MQLHGDLPSVALPINKISFRQNGGNTVNFNGIRSLDLELFCANSLVKFDNASTTFALNYSSPATKTIARKTINIGPEGPNSSPGPAAFAGLDLVLDQPFVFQGPATLVWEAVIYANTSVSGSFNSPDADQSSLTAATVTQTGLGCIAAGKTLRMVQGLIANDVAGTFAFAPGLANAPAGAQAVLALGTSNPNTAVPGLCSNLLTNLVTVIPMPNVDANGLIQADAGFGFLVKNTSPGASVYSQVHVLDAGRADPLKVCNSDGYVTVVPAANPAKKLLVTRLYNTLGGTTATQGMFTADTFVGYGLVTAFQ
jgi:hypothetical protein